MKRLYRVEVGKKLCGVCGGIAEYFDLDPTMVRLGVVVVGLITGFFPVLIGYVLACIIVPRKSHVIFPQQP